MRVLGISEERANIIFCSLGAKSKQEITIALLSTTDDDNSEIIRVIRKIPNFASRNHLAHSIRQSEKDGKWVNFIKRDIAKGHLTLTGKHFLIDELFEHPQKLNHLVGDLMTAAKISDADFSSYILHFEEDAEE